MSLHAIIKNKHRRLLSKTWRTVLTARQIERNNYQVTGDLHKAKDFAIQAVTYEPKPFVFDEYINEPVVIYSRKSAVTSAGDYLTA